MKDGDHQLGGASHVLPDAGYAHQCFTYLQFMFLAKRLTFYPPPLTSYNHPNYEYCFSPLFHLVVLAPHPIFDVLSWGEGGKVIPPDE